jgi:hypothetical protein
MMIAIHIIGKWIGKESSVLDDVEHRFHMMIASGNGCGKSGIV